MSAVLRQELRDFEIAGQDLLVQIRSLRVLKGKEAADHGVEHHAAAPDVRLEAQVLLACDHLRSGVARRAASRFQLLLRSRSVHITQPEVDNFQSLVVVEQQVLRLQVSVADAALVDVLDAGDELLVHAAGRLLVEALMRHNIIEELTVLTILHDEEKLTFSFNDFKQLDYIRVPHLLQDLDLPRYPLDVLLVLDSRLLEYLNGHLLVCKSVHCQLDLSEGALAERLSQNVVAEPCALRMRILLVLILLMIPSLVAFMALIPSIRWLVIRILSLLLSALRRLVACRGRCRGGCRGLRLIIIFNSSHSVFASLVSDEKFNYIKLEFELI